MSERFCALCGRLGDHRPGLCRWREGLKAALVALLAAPALASAITVVSPRIVVAPRPVYTMPRPVVSAPKVPAPAPAPKPSPATAATATVPATGTSWLPTWLLFWSATTHQQGAAEPDDKASAPRKK